MRGGGGGGGGMFNVGQNKAKRQKSEDVDTTFGDVAGIESAKNELKEIVEYLKHPKKFEDLGAKTPTGVLLVGPPGTGKTLLARAVAGEADVPFFSISGSDFMEMFVGVGASRVRNLFKDAKKKSPCIIFIDELDSIGRSRGAGLGGGHDEREQTLNQLLSELDGFEKNENVVVLAGTNRPDILDKALLRPGRFDRRVTTHLPTMADRKLILELHAKEKSIADDVDLEKVARNTPGFSGADLSNLLNEAALQAAREGKEEMDQQSVDTARDKILLGLERKGVALSDHDKKVLAYHEAGHAVVSALMENAEPVHKVTIIPRENSMGVTQQLPERDRFLYEKAYLEDRLTVMMGGRASEQYKMSTLTSGAENDLKQAQQLARKMVLDWGMSERYANVAHGGERKAVFLGEDIGQQRDYSDQTAYQIDEQIEKILTEAYDRARSTLEENEKGLEKLAEALLDREEVPGSEVYELLGIARED
jgi:cell division protease FtsH